MSALTLPDPIAAYFAAEIRGPDDVARCFTGSPIDLKLSFRLERGLIASLEITA